MLNFYQRHLLIFCNLFKLIQCCIFDILSFRVITFQNLFDLLIGWLSRHWFGSANWSFTSLFINLILVYYLIDHIHVNDIAFLKFKVDFRKKSFQTACEIFGLKFLKEATLLSLSLNLWRPCEVDFKLTGVGLPEHTLEVFEHVLNV